MPALTVGASAYMAQTYDPLGCRVTTTHNAHKDRLVRDRVLPLHKHILPKNSPATDDDEPIVRSCPERPILIATQETRRLNAYLVGTLVRLTDR